MPRVIHVKKARKAHKQFGIKKGQEYWWWSNRIPGRKAGRKRVSFTYPKPSQVAGNPFTSAVLALQERLGGLNDEMTADDIKSEIEAVAEEVRALAEEQDEKLQNMPEGLQAGPSGELLGERKEALEAWADELDGLEVDEDDVSSAVEEAQGSSPEV